MPHKIKTSLYGENNTFFLYCTGLIYRHNFSNLAGFDAV